VDAFAIAPQKIRYKIFESPLLTALNELNEGSALRLLPNFLFQVGITVSAPAR
jgi:hypothetical protein